jgi:uncharacterized protein YciI
MPEKLHALFYEYVGDMADRRGPHRAAHLELIQQWHADGRIAIAGALGDPPAEGLMVFRLDDPAEVEAFVAADPYAQNDLVVSHRVVPWTVVT